MLAGTPSVTVAPVAATADSLVTTSVYVITSPGETRPILSPNFAISSDGPTSVSTELLGIGARSGDVGSSVAVLVTVAPPLAVIVASNVNVFVPGWIVTAFQLTVPDAKVHAGEQLPA